MRLVLIVLLALAGSLVPSAARANNVVPLPAGGAVSLDRLPAPVRASLATRLGADDPDFQFRLVDEGYSVSRPGTGFVATVASVGLTVAVAERGWSLRTTGLGRSDTASGTLWDGTPLLGGSGNRVEIDRGLMREWFVSSPAGFEQGWTIDERPAGDGALELWLASDRDLRLETDEILVLDAQGEPWLRYGGLHAHDSLGRALATRFVIGGEALKIVVDDLTAEYPITIDPFIDQATLSATGGSGGDKLGTAVAISADGTTIVVGAPGRTTPAGANAGAVYVYTRPANGWVGPLSQSAILTATNAVAGAETGTSVAVSGDGAYIVAGAPKQTVAGATFAGTAFVFLRPRSGWTGSVIQTTSLIASSVTSLDQVGYSVGMSRDGATIVAGAPYRSGGAQGAGTLFVYTRPANGWTGASLPQATLTASGPAINDNLGLAVAISADGSTIVGGAPNHGTILGADAGAVYLFLRPGGGWTGAVPSQSILTSALMGGGDIQLGLAVAVSADGGTVVAGEPGRQFTINGVPDSPTVGAVSVFVRPVGGWPTSKNPDSLLALYDLATLDALGASVAINDDGNLIVAGAPFRLTTAGSGVQTAVGEGYVFQPPASGWPATLPQAYSFQSPVPLSFSKLGTAVAISGDGTTLAIGAPGRSSNKGVVEVFSVGTPTASITGLSALAGSPTVLGTPTLFAATVTAGDSISYSWTFGDGTGGSGAVAQHTYSAPGTYQATVTATNAKGGAQASVSVTVIGPPAVGGTTVAEKTSASALITANVDGQGSAAVVRIEYGTSAGGPYPNSVAAMPGSVLAAKAADISGRLVNLQPQTTYFLRVRAENVAGVSYSPEGSFTTSVPLTFLPIVTRGAGW